MLLLQPGGVSFSQSVDIPGGRGVGPHPTWGGPHSTLELGGGGGNIIPGCFLQSQYEWLWERNIFSQSVDIPGGRAGTPSHVGGTPSHMGGTPFNS